MPIPAEAFFLDRDVDIHLQAQLRRQVIDGILQGRFRAGEKLPSSRLLAQRLGVARVTVAQAFAELVASDYLTSRDRAGHFISERIDPLPVPKSPHNGATRFDWTQRIDNHFARTERRDRVPNWRSYRFPFVYGQADAGLIDHAAWRDCAVRALGRREFAPLTNDLYAADDPELIDYIMRQILPRRGIRAQANEILLTLGAQNGLWLAAEILLGRGGTVAIEDPCYPGMRQILSPMGGTIIPIPIDAKGLDPATLPAGLTAVFTTASHHCPTGIAMPIDRRRALLSRALRDGFAIVEDDYEFEMSFAGSPSPALKARDETGAVIYIGSFSKTVFPGLRLGYMVADPAVIAEARALRSLSLRHPPGMLQRTLAHYLSLGHYDTQMRRMRIAYAQRRAAMAAAIQAEGLTPVTLADQGAPYSGSNGGSSFWMRLPDGYDARKLATRLHGQDVLIEPGSPFFADPEQGRSFYRLAYSSIPLDRIPEGIARIARALRD